jgi:thiol-disulfide isomerase/thioredoxin
MKIILLSIIAFFTIASAQAQTSESSKMSAGEYFNNFQKYTNESPNADAAFYNVQKLASNPAYMSLATDLIHNSFAQEFIIRSEKDSADMAMRAERRRLATQILMRMNSDKSPLVRQQSQPLFIFTKVQEAGNNTDTLRKLTNQFIKSEVDGQDIYQDRAGRYGLLILDIIEKYPGLKVVSDELADKIAAQIQAGQVAVTDSTSSADLDKRAWYRFLNAYIHFKKSEQTIDRKQKEDLLRIAFEFSPDLVDKNHGSGYFYDMHMLLGMEKEGFQDEYLKFISTNSDKEQVLAALLKMALVEPSYKKNLKAVHQEVTLSDNFGAYWKNGIDASAVTAPLISLKVLEKPVFSSKSLSGQWILVDFWGTWCGPCRAEHPALQKFYDSVAVDKSKKIALLTVACRDTESRVTAYMTKNRYNFPVAISDNQIEKSFKVQGYPTKVLITPTGKYVTVPFGVDWVSFVNKYVEVD